jgi:RimJ/RimL family protein N-acetyltransferase
VKAARRDQAVYDIRVAGHLDDHWSDWMGHLALTRHEDGTTSLTGPVADQAQLHGVLAAVRDIGATLLELHAVEPLGPATSSPPVASSQPRVFHRSSSHRDSQVTALERPLRTERLMLRPATAADADVTWTFRQLREVNEWLTGTPSDLDAYRDLFTDPARLATTVVVQLGHDAFGHVIGDLMLRREDGWAQREVAAQAEGAQVELGWVLDPAHVGHGYATEAVRALLHHCFDDLGVHRAVASCFLANDSSWRLMERVGMRREGHAVRESLHRTGRWLDTVTYALLADEWQPS